MYWNALSSTCRRINSLALPASGTRGSSTSPRRRRQGPAVLAAARDGPTSDGPTVSVPDVPPASAPGGVMGGRRACECVRMRVIRMQRVDRMHHTWGGIQMHSNATHVECNALRMHNNTYECTVP